MTSLRHKLAIARIRTNAYKLTPREREALGLPRRPIRRPIEPPPFPSDPSAYAWFVLTTLPQQEAAVASRLARGGHAAFNPTEAVLVRASRRLKFRRFLKERALLTSMVLAGFRCIRDEHDGVIRARVPWPDVLGLEGVTGVIGFEDGPAPVPCGNVVALHRLHGRRAVTRNWSPSLDDLVEVVHGPFKHKPGKIVGLADGRAKVMLFGEGIFSGHVTPLEVPETWLAASEPVPVNSG